MTIKLGTHKLYQALSLLEQLKKDDPTGKYKAIPIKGMLEWEVVMDV